MISLMEMMCSFAASLRWLVSLGGGGCGNDGSGGGGDDAEGGDDGGGGGGREHTRKRTRSAHRCRYPRYHHHYQRWGMGHGGHAHLPLAPTLSGVLRHTSVSDSEANSIGSQGNEAQATRCPEG